MLLQRIDTHRQQFIEDYNKKINKETAKMQSNAYENCRNSEVSIREFSIMNYHCTIIEKEIKSLILLSI